MHPFRSPASWSTSAPTRAWKNWCALVTHEYPQAWTKGDIEYYPVRNEDSEALFTRYRDDADQLSPRVHFGGRLGEYRYYDMHQVVGAALAFCDNVRG